MSSLTLLNARKELAAQLGLDHTNTDTSTLLDRWLDLAYDDIVGNYDWSWLESRETVTMATDYTTGTVDLTAASATITFSATIAASQANRMIQFSSFNDWYLISAHTAGTDTATISPAYIQSSNATADTFTIRTFKYALSSSAEYVYSVREAETQQEIDILSAGTYDEKAAFTDTTGTPRMIIFWGQDSSGNWEFTPYPFPDQALLLEFRIYKKKTTLSADGDTALFPDRFNSTWLYGAKVYGYEFLDDTRSSSARINFQGKIKALRGRDDIGRRQIRVLRSIDEAPNVGNIIRFPAEFGDIS